MLSRTTLESCAKVLDSPKSISELARLWGVQPRFVSKHYIPAMRTYGMNILTLQRPGHETKYQLTPGKK